VALLGQGSKYVDMLLCSDASPCTALSPRAERHSSRGCLILTLIKSFQVCLHCLHHYSCMVYRMAQKSYIDGNIYHIKYSNRCTGVPMMHWPQRSPVCHFLLAEPRTNVFSISRHREHLDMMLMLHGVGRVLNVKVIQPAISECPCRSVIIDGEHLGTS